jgi:hypothetical protein
VLDIARGRVGRRRRELVPEDDLAVTDPEERPGFLARPVAARLRPLAELERRAHRLAVRLEPDDRAGTGQRLMPALGLVEPMQPARPIALNHACTVGEEPRSLFVVAGVHRSRPSADDALRRGLRVAAAAEKRGEQH